MQTYLVLISVTLLAGLTMPLGALIARFEHIRPRWIEEELRHSVMAFGGGALLSAIGLVLIPEGIKNQSMLLASLYFIGGGLSFMLLDIILYKINTPASQLAAMLADFVPESIALGAAFATGSKSAFLLAVLIALQNLPEGFNAYRELASHTTHRPKRIIKIFFMMAILGPIAGLSGYIYLSDAPTVISAIMLFASGGILYSVFQDIAPQVKLEQHWAPPMGAILGFLVGIIGLMLTHQ